MRSLHHYAEVARIEKWNDTNKYILFFKDHPIRIEPIPLNKARKGLAPQAPLYTSLQRLLKAKDLGEVF